MKEEMLWNGVRLFHGAHDFALSTDAVLAADFLTLCPDDRVADLGTGSGAIGLMLCAREASCRVTGIEIQEEFCRTARENIARNKLQERFSLLHGDLRQIRALLPANGFDCVISNPPYFPVGSGGVSSDPALAIARTELCCTLQELCAAAGWLLRSGGSFALVHRPERLCDLFCQLRANRIEPKRIRFVRHTAASAVCLVLMEGRLDAKAGLRYMPDLIQFTPDGRETDEYRAIYHRDAPQQVAAAPLD